MKNYTLWLIPATPHFGVLQSKINNLSKIYQTPTFQPHITIGSKINLPIKVLNARISDLIQSNIFPFELKIRGLATRYTFYQSLFYDINLNKNLIAFYEAIVEKMDISPKVFRPHISLLYSNLDSQEIDKLIKSFNEDFNHAIRFDKLAIVETIGPVKNWKIIKTFILKVHP